MTETEMGFYHLEIFVASLTPTMLYIDTLTRDIPQAEGEKEKVPFPFPDNH